MKTKKIRLFAGVLILALSMTFISCDCGRNELESPIVGTWVLTEWIKTELNWVVNGEDSILLHKNFPVSEKVSPMIFSSNGRGTVTTANGTVNINWRLNSREWLIRDYVSVSSVNAQFSKYFWVENPTTLIWGETRNEGWRIYSSIYGDIAIPIYIIEMQTWTKIQ